MSIQQTASKQLRQLFLVPAIFAVGLSVPVTAQQTSSEFSSVSPPNPNPGFDAEWLAFPAEGMPTLPVGIDIGPDGHVWVLNRCNACAATEASASILKFDANTGRLLTSLDVSNLVEPRRLHVDSDGNIWVLDVDATQGTVPQHSAVKFGPDGTTLLTLDIPGPSGRQGSQLYADSLDIATSRPAGDIFITDASDNYVAGSPSVRGTGYVMRFDRNGDLVDRWQVGSPTTQRRGSHALALDSDGRVYVSDTANNQIQIFSRRGQLLDTYESFGGPDDLYITENDVLYAIDTQSTAPNQYAPIRMGPASEDQVLGIIPPSAPAGNASPLLSRSKDALAVDPNGHIFVTTTRFSPIPGVPRYEMNVSWKTTVYMRSVPEQANFILETLHGRAPKTGITPDDVPNVPLGTWKYEVSKEGYKSYNSTIDLLSGDRRLQCTLVGEDSTDGSFCRAERIEN